MIYYHHQAQSKISTDRETTVQSGGQLACLGTKHHPTTCQAPMDVKSMLLNRANSHHDAQRHIMQQVYRDKIMTRF